MSKKLVIVESPAKSKTINKYLGKDFTVLASYGHIRDLPSKEGSVDVDHKYKMKWASDNKNKKVIEDIAKAMKDADELYLATDLDREGEAISWHVYKVLEKKKLLEGKIVKRIVFNEITKTAILDSFNHARDIDKKMVESYLARRALDYLVGFNISPVLWRKLPGAKSAGRVQSVALRLVCEREQEIEDFVAQEYWSIEGKFINSTGDLIESRLYEFENNKVEKLDIKDEKSATEILEKLQNAKEYKVASLEEKLVSRNPFAPFITSSLQIDASRRLGFGANKTMMTAQQLYEGINIGGEHIGLISYMRTDSINLSQEAINGARDVISKEFGPEYLPKSPRVYKKKAKGAQEAHEAIRPTILSRKPEDIKAYLTEEQFKLYDLIWKRTIACQMSSAKFNQATLDINADEVGTFRATGFITVFDGFRKVYNTDNDEEKTLPKVKENESLKKEEITSNQHFTKPPARYSEASLVKQLEDLGIGRPSTYASIMKVLKAREYVRVEQRRFIPEQKGRLVNSFLKNYFLQYIEYDFTSELEESLDLISDGERDWVKVLDDFWKDFKVSTEKGMELDHAEIKTKITDDLAKLLFPDGNRKCPKCGEGHLELNFGKYGEFLGCSRYPDCDYKKSFTHHKGEEDRPDFEDKILGKDKEGKNILFKEGPYGFYVEIEKDKETKGKPKRAGLPKGMKPEDIDLNKAIELLSLPKTLGKFENEEVKAGIGRYGNYVLYKGAFHSSHISALDITLEEAIEIIKEAEKNPKGKATRKKAEPLKELGKHGKEDIAVYSGRYGPYVKCGKVNATIPKDKKPEELTLEEAIELIEAKK